VKRKGSSSSRAGINRNSRDVQYMIDVGSGFCNKTRERTLVVRPLGGPSTRPEHFSKLLTASMAPKEPTKHQLSARLTYAQHTPAFLRKLQSRISGIPDDDDSDENLNEEFEDDGSGRPPIPRRPRPPIPERPAGDPGSGDEDRDDEAPQVVVLKEGKHLNAREVESEKRKAKGLPPLPDPSTVTTAAAAGSVVDAKKLDVKERKGLSFSSSSSSGPAGSTFSKSRHATAKRKVVGGEEDVDGDGDEGGSAGAASASKVKKVKKKPKVLVGLSFADDA